MFAPGSSVASSSKTTFTSARRLHASARRLATGANHYETLDLPKSATRQQIKAQFYRLSKEYHPDVKSGNGAKFQAISEAYATLGNADARKVYDSSMTASSSNVHHYRPGGATPGQQYGHYESDAGARRSRANYAWESTRRSNPKYQQHHRQSPFASHTHSRQTSHHHEHDSHFDRMQAREAWRATNMSSGARKRAAFESQQMAKEEDLRNTSGIGRAIQLVGMFIAVLWIGGTLRASAWEKDNDIEGLKGAVDEHVRNDSAAPPQKGSSIEGKDKDLCTLCGTTALPHSKPACN